MANKLVSDLTKPVPWCLGIVPVTKPLESGAVAQHAFRYGGASVIESDLVEQTHAEYISIIQEVLDWRI